MEKPRLLDRVRYTIRALHYSRKTEQVYGTDRRCHSRQTQQENTGGSLTRRNPGNIPAPRAALPVDGQPYVWQWLRLMEMLRLRLKDIDSERKAILIRAGKGDKDRVTILPDNVVDTINVATQRAAALHQQDLSEGYGELQMPYALARKYPNQAKSLHWQFPFASRRSSWGRCWVSSDSRYLGIR